MNKTIRVIYNSDTLKTSITIDGKSFDTSRINGIEISYWAYPFMIRNVHWKGFYDEMVGALDGEKAFNLVFEGSEKALNELRESLNNFPVTIISEENSVIVRYDENNLTTEITVNGKSFDTSRIYGIEIVYWAYPFMIRNVHWKGFYDEMVEALDGEKEFNLVFEGSAESLVELKEALKDKPVKVIAGESSIKPITIISGESFIDNSSKDKLRQAEDLFIHGNFKSAFEMFSNLADAGNGRAMYFLGEYYAHGIYGIEKDEEKATYWRAKGVETGDPLAKLNASYIFKNGSEEQKQILKEMFPIVKAMAENGDIIAQNEIGNCYFFGCGVERDCKKAVEWCRKSAEQGYFKAQGNLGAYYYLGVGVEQDYNKAVEWYRKSAEQGGALSQCNLGNCYKNGQGVIKDYNKSIEWYRKSAEQGYALAQGNLGTYYYLGIGVEQDYNKAVEWFRKSAEQGDRIAQSNLGYCYQNGWGTKQDYNEAVKWYRKSIEQGYDEAYYNLGWCYLYGLGVNENEKKAKELFQKGASLGNEDCKEALETIK
ncbi:MAG: sel1 repeat family protein [Ruminococcus sp.]|nr:sel1 repeat family protein [Ruminococcus sp.]